VSTAADQTLHKLYQVFTALLNSNYFNRFSLFLFYRERWRIYNRISLIRKACFSWRKCCYLLQVQWTWAQLPVVSAISRIQTRVPYLSNRDFCFIRTHITSHSDTEKRNDTSGSGDLFCWSDRLCCVLLRSEAHSDRKHISSVQKLNTFTHLILYKKCNLPASN